jgi:hypothetical protein
MLNMDFGGPEGMLLPRLKRITALHDSDCNILRGLVFSYTDGSKKFFGMRKIIKPASNHWSRPKQTFSIDGPGGERIVSLQFGLVKSRVDKYVREIKVWYYVILSCTKMY